MITYKLSEAIAGLGHNVDYIAIAPEEYQKEIGWANFIYLEQAIFTRQLFQSLKTGTKDYDVIHLHQANETTGYCLGLGIKKIFDKSRRLVFSIYAPEVHGTPRSFNELCSMATCRTADVVLSLSEFSKRNISNAFHVPTSKIKVTHAGVDEKFFTATRKRKEVKENFKLLFVGRLNGPREQKGVDVLLKAMPLILEKHGVMLNIIGTGSRADEYKKLAKDLKIDKRVEFSGRVEHEKLPERYANADLFVFPSRRESFGLVLAEAMAAGLPVVSTKVGAIPEVVEDGEAGILVQPDDPRKFAEAVNTLLNNPEKMKTMGLKGRERVRKYFTWDKVAMRVIKYYDEILIR